MKPFISSRLLLGVAAVTTSLVLLGGCDRRPTDVPPPTTDQTQRDRTTNPPMPQSAPAVPAPETSPTPPASSPAIPAPGGTPQ